MEKRPEEQESYDLSVYADEVIEACMGALLILAEENKSGGRRTRKTQEAEAPEGR